MLLRRRRSRPRLDAGLRRAPRAARSRGAEAEAPASPVARELEGAVEAFLQDSEPFPGAAEDEARVGAPGPRARYGYLAHPVTPRGEALLAGRGRAWTPWDRRRAEAFTRAARDRVRQDLVILPPQEGETLSRGLDVEVARAAADGGEPTAATPPQEAGARTGAARLPDWLARNFDHPLWRSFALRCHGCGACAAVCSTCHCFDIVDEHDSYDRGARRRNWDSCQTAKFTLHASGHNPRQTQTERFRQRVMHKFSVYPSRFDADPLHRLRPLRPRLRRRHEPARGPRPARPARRRRGRGPAGHGRAARAAARGRERPMNVYQPHRMRIEEITDETFDTRTFKLAFRDERLREDFQFSAGQFGEYSVFGEGESTFCIASPPDAEGLHRVQLQGGRQGDAGHAPARAWATPSASAGPTGTPSRSTR